MNRSAFRAGLLLGPIVALVACGSADLLQGDAYEPDERLTIADATDRTDTGCTTCDAGQPDVEPPPIGDGAAPPTNTCETARVLGKLAVDTGSETLNATGTCSEWLRFRATEESTSPAGKAMKVKLTLDSAVADFDLYAYFDPIRDVLSCQTPFARSAHAGPEQETLSLTWGEGSVANADDDARDISVAVIKIGASCGPDAGSWTLKVEGNR